MNGARTAAVLTGTALGAIAVFAAPIAAQAAPTTSAAPGLAHTTITGWGHNLPGGAPVGIHGNSLTRHLKVSPGGVRTLEINDATCKSTATGTHCSSKVIEVVRTNAHGQIALTLPVHNHVDAYSVFVRRTSGASTAETIHWGVYKA